MNSTTSAFFAIDSSGPSMNVSIPSPTQKIKSASSRSFACDGLSVKL